MGASSGSQAWPSLPLEAWSETCATLHMWTQIVGKIRLAQSPWINHSWHVTLYVTARGLTTSPIPHGDSTFEIDFDFIDHQLIVQVSDGAHRRPCALEPQSVAAFYGRLMEEMRKLGLHVKIHRKPERGSRPDPFRPGRGSPLVRSRSTPTGSGESSCRRTGSSRSSARRFIGKCSPVHFFWGGPDLAVTRFSGRRAPEHPGRDSQPARLGHPRGLLARSQQLRLLARRRGCSLRRVLLLRLSGTGRIRASARPARRGVLQQRAWGVHPALRCRPAGGLARSRAARVPADHLRGRSQSGRLGSRFFGTWHRGLENCHAGLDPASTVVWTQRWMPGHSPA